MAPEDPDPAEEKSAKREILRMLARKGYLSSELRDKLLAKGFSPPAIEQALAFCKQKGFIDDDQELGRIVRREQRKGRGPQGILWKLKQKKVSPDQLEALSIEIKKEEKQSLEELIQKRYSKSDWKDPKARQKMIGQLHRRGFSFDAIFQSLRIDADWH